MKIRILLPVACIALSASLADAQQRPPIRQLGAVTAKSPEQFVNIAGVRALSNGSVLVNDLPGRRVLLFDSQLSRFTVIADSTSATGNAFGNRGGSLIPYRGDTTIFADPVSVSMLVINPEGKVARVMAIPRAEDAMAIGSGMGNATFDASGRLVYRAMPGFRMGGQQRRVIEGGATPAAFAAPDIPDSAAIVRVDVATRKVDTLGFIKTPKIKLETRTDDRGGISIQSLVNPLPVVDDWAVLPDGSVAFVRGRDYHVDIVNPNGSRMSAPKIPFDWQRLTEEDKIAFIDSVKAARARMPANANVVAGGAPAAGGGGDGSPRVQIFMGPGGGGPGGGPPQRGGAGGPGGPGAASGQMNFVPASELPDHKPPFFANSTRADAEGNLWIRTIPTSAVAGGPVYDVINRKGELVDRVQIPAGRTIIGFDAAGSAYLLNREGTTATLEKAKIR